jgi:hypothetical protein
VRFTLIALLTSLAACAGDPLPVSRAPDDPSNPAAPEAPSVLPSTTLAPSTPLDEAGAPPHSHHHGMPGMGDHE